MSPNEPWVDRERVLLFGQQQVSRLPKAAYQTACDQAEDTGKLNLHRHCGVKHVDDASHRLTQLRDTEGQPVAVPSFAEGAAP